MATAPPRRGPGLISAYYADYRRALVCPEAGCWEQAQGGMTRNASFADPSTLNPDLSLQFRGRHARPDVAVPALGASRPRSPGAGIPRLGGPHPGPRSPGAGIPRLCGPYLGPRSPGAGAGIPRLCGPYLGPRSPGKGAPRPRGPAHTAVSSTKACAPGFARTRGDHGGTEFTAVARRFLELLKHATLNNVDGSDQLDRAPL
jgi:hypothetical protein